MKLAKLIREQINNMPQNSPFGYMDLKINNADYVNAAKIMERLQKEGVVKKVSKGIFYKPQKSIFGELKPEYNKLLRPYLFEDGKRIAYITGTYLYNQLNLTSQIPFKIKIASRSKRIFINSGAIKADAVKSYAEVNDHNYEILGLLDALKDIKKIPDSNINQSIKILDARIEKLDNKKKYELIKYGLLYPPRVKALLGAILENQNNLGPEINKLKESLNPLTIIKIGINKIELPTIKNWNII